MWMYLFYHVLPFPVWKSRNEKDIEQHISNNNNNNIKLSVLYSIITQQERFGISSESHFSKI